MLYRVLCCNDDGPQFVWNNLEDDEVYSVYVLLEDNLQGNFQFYTYNMCNDVIDIQKFNYVSSIAWPESRNIDFVSDCDPVVREMITESLLN